jgi:hypothetical protein
MFHGKSESETIRMGDTVLRLIFCSLEDHFIMICISFPGSIPYRFLMADGIDKKK